MLDTCVNCCFVAMLEMSPLSPTPPPTPTADAHRRSLPSVNRELSQVLSMKPGVGHNVDDSRVPPTAKNYYVFSTFVFSAHSPSFFLNPLQKKRDV